LSRGAATADFVEFRPSSLHALKANVAALRLRDRTRIFKRDAFPFIAELAPASYDVAFADPPYDTRLVDRVIAMWQEKPFSRWLAVEHARGHQLPRGAHRATFGDSAITLYRSP
jgi:16S rRNA (guanine966-N2)-methyltransferase